jgi:hypothetical protein
MWKPFYTVVEYPDGLWEDLCRQVCEIAARSNQGSGEGQEGSNQADSGPDSRSTESIQCVHQSER